MNKITPCGDDGPEDGSISFFASVVIHCHLPMGHTGSQQDGLEIHEGHNSTGTIVRWTHKKPDECGMGVKVLK